MNEMTLLKIVDGRQHPLVVAGSAARTAEAPARESRTRTTSPLKKISDTAYCFQFCGPLSIRDSNHRRKRRGRYFPSMIQARYLLSGTEITVATIKIAIGKSQMVIRPTPLAARRGGTVSEPFRPYHRHRQIHQQKNRHGDREIVHRSHPFTCLQEQAAKRHRRQAQHKQKRQPDPQVHALFLVLIAHRVRIPVVQSMLYASRLVARTL